MVRIEFLRVVTLGRRQRNRVLSFVLAPFEKQLFEGAAEFFRHDAVEKKVAGRVDGEKKVKNVPQNWN